MDVSAKVFLKDTFRKYDRDRSGAIDQSELRAIFEDLNIHFSDEALGRLLNKYDLDGSGVLEFDEFIQMLKPYFPPTDPKALNDAQVGQLKALFSRFDRNGDGQIDTSELKAVLEAKGAKVSDSQVRNILELYDADNSGCLSFEEFVNMIMCRT